MSKWESKMSLFVFFTFSHKSWSLIGQFPMIGHNEIIQCKRRRDFTVNQNLFDGWVNLMKVREGTECSGHMINLFACCKK